MVSHKKLKFTSSKIITKTPKTQKKGKTLSSCPNVRRNAGNGLGCVRIVLIPWDSIKVSNHGWVCSYILLCQQNLNIINKQEHIFFPKKKNYLPSFTNVSSSSSPVLDENIATSCDSHVAFAASSSTVKFDFGMSKLKFN